MKYALYGVAMLFYLIPHHGYAQEQSGITDKVINSPTKLFSRIEGKTASLDQRLTRQTEKYLQKMARREARFRKKLFRIDSAAAKRLFANSTQQYAALEQKISSDTGSHRPIRLSGEYMP